MQTLLLLLFDILCPLNVSCCQEGWTAFSLAPLIPGGTLRVLPAVWFRRPRASQYCTRSKVDEGWLLAVD
jgi:hypothetical protein